jgi:hypothetical protein
MFEVYRWAGTTPEQFRKHYIEVHAQLGKKIPGIVWYETFLNEEPTADWQAQERPRPDAYVIMKLESEEVFADLRNAEEWRIAKEDDIGFASHSFSQRVERITWIADIDPVVVNGYSAE